MNSRSGGSTFASLNTAHMKYAIQIEETAFFILALLAIYYQPLQFSWWVWILLFLLPDLGMLGYFVNVEMGAHTYNLLHHRAVGAAVWLLGLYTQQPYITLTGIILLGHSSFDRALGYGLKFPDSFKHTHLGWL